MNVIGLELGQATECSAIAVIRVGRTADNTKEAYDVVHLERFQPGTPYAAILMKLREILASGLNLITVIDQTGVGSKVVESFTSEVRHSERVQITAGHTTSRDEAKHWLLPKKELVGVMQLLLQENQLRVSRVLEHAELLTKELVQFRTRVTLKETDSVESWREGADDDLVFAVGLACWWAVNHPPYVPGEIYVGSNNELMEMLDRVCPEHPSGKKIWEREDIWR